MAVRGAKPKPSHLKLVQGNPGKRALNKNEPKPKGDLTEPPAHFTETQRAGWKYAIDNSPRGLLKKLDRSLLVAWVVAEDLHRQATEAVNRQGLIVKSPVKGEPMQNPYLAIVNKQAAIMVKAAADLGFTPSSRSRISVEPDGEGKQDNPFAEFAD